MTSSAVTASMCASASDVALFVASFMPLPPWIGHDSSLRKNTRKRWLEFYSERPCVDLALRVPTRHRSTAGKIGW